jgi:hypothetical protein
MSVHDDFLKEGKDASDSVDINLVYDLVIAIKILKINWSIENSKRFGKNEPFIDIAIARHYEKDGYYLFLRHCVNLVHDVTGIKTMVCCDVLSFKLYDVTQQNQLQSKNVEFHVPNELAKRFKEGRFVFLSVHSWLSSSHEDAKYQLSSNRTSFNNRILNISCVSLYFS